nr:collagen alpha-1(XXIV) chain [Dasypus novemcinctus]
MSQATGPGALPRLRGGEPAAALRSACVGPGRSWRGIQRPWGRRWAAGASGDLGARRRSRSAVWETRCVSAERLQECGRPWGRRPAAETAEANEALGTPRTAGSVEAVSFPGAVWVNGAVAEPEVVGPAGSVWVTRTGEEKTNYGSPRGCEGRGRPGSLGHESILELWLKVQAMRAASGCGDESRIELYAMPAGEGPVERGIPGRASWVETNRGHLTGPWMKGQARAVPQATRVATAFGLGADPERASGLYGQEQPVRVPRVVGFPGTLETRSGIAPRLWWRGQAVEVPGTVENIGSGVSPGSWGKGPTMGMPQAMGWLEAVGLPRAVEGEIDCGTPCLSVRGQSVQGPGALAEEAVYGDTPGLRGRGHPVGVPRAVEEKRSSAGTLGLWPRRQVVEEIGSGGIPGLWGIGQPVVVPCAIKEQATCGGDPGFRERGQAVWVETGSGDDPGSRYTAWNAEVPGPDEQELDSGGIPGLWGIKQATGVPGALKEKMGCGSLQNLWGTERPVRASQAVVVLGGMGEETCYDGVLGLWGRQQALGVSAADTAPDVAGEETCCGRVQSRWERRQAVGEQDALVPTALGLSGPVDQETGYGDISHLCGRRQTLGAPETAGIPKKAGIPKHRHASPGEPTAVDVHASGRVPVAVWVSGPTGQKTNTRSVLDLWDSVHAARIPTSSGVPMASGVPPPFEEDTNSGAFPGSWGRRQAFKVPVAARVPVASEVPGLAGEEYGSGGVPGSWGRSQTARIPVAAEVPIAPRVPGPLGLETGSGSFSGLLERRQMARVPVAARRFTPGGVSVAPRAPRPVQEETGSQGGSGLWEGKQTAGVPAGAKGSTTMGVPVSARMPGPMGKKTGSGGISSLLRGRQTAGVPMAEGLHPATGVPGTVGVEPCSGGPLGLWGRRQAVGIPLAAGVPGPAVGATTSGEVSGIWGRSQATEVPFAARVPVPVEGETGSESVSGLWRRQENGTVPDTLRVPQSLGVLAVVGVPVAGRMPAAVWVTGSTGEKTNGTVRGQSAEESGPAGEDTESRSILGLAGKRQAVGETHTYGGGTKLWGCSRSVGEGRDSGNVLGVSGTRMTVEVPEAVDILPVVREETGLGHFGDHLPQSGRKQAAEVSEGKLRGGNLQENYVGEGRL